jgi:E3 ubiquitin-protein ligase BOI-like protein
MISAPVFLGEPGGGHPLAAAAGGNTAFSDLTCIINNKDDSGCAGQPRKRARVGDVAGAGFITDLQGQRALPPLPMVPTTPQAFAATGDVQSIRMLCSGAASTSGRPATASIAPASQGIISHLYRHGVEMDALIRIEVRCRLDL